MANNQKIIIYIASPKQVQIFKERCEPYSDVMKVGTFNGLGAPGFFDNLAKALSGTQAAYTIFDLPTTLETVQAKVFTEEIRKYIKDGIVKKTKMFVIDPEHVYKADGRAVFEKFGVKVIDAVEEIGGPFAALDDTTRAAMRATAIEDPMFEELAEKAIPSSGKKGNVAKTGVPSFKEVPTSVSKTSFDPFAQLDDGQGNDYDPFAAFDSYKAANRDPFDDDDPLSGFEDDFKPGAASPVAVSRAAGAGYADDYEDDFVDDPGDFVGSDLSGFDDAFDKAFTDAFEDDFQNDFDATNGFDDYTDDYADEFDDDGFSDAFDADFSAAQGSPARPPAPSPSPRQTQDLRGDSQDMTRIDPFEDMGAPAEDPFASLGSDAPPHEQQGTGFGDDGFADDGFADEGFADPMPRRNGRSMGGVPPVDIKPGPDGTISIDDILTAYSGYLSDQDFEKLLSMKEPEWDYELSQDDIGGGGLLGGSKKKSKKLSQVDNATLVDSTYIADCNAEGGYDFPEETKIAVIWSPKGGTGKALIDTTPILRYNPRSKYHVEKTTVGDIELGDRIFGSDGTPVEVVGVYPQGELDVYEITLQDGRTIQCSKDHLWNVFEPGERGRNGKQATKSLEELMSQPLLAGGEYRWRLPVAGALRYPVQNLRVPPYVYGTLIGAGCPDGEDSALRTVDVGTFGDVQEHLRNGRIPDVYLESSVEQRGELLRGLLDVLPESGRTTIRTASRDLCDDIMTLVRSLGRICTCSGNEDGESFTISIWDDDEADGGIAITDIRALGRKEPMTCFKVDAEDELFVAGEFVVTHNTAVATMLATQLNWYFNRELMQGGVTQNARVLLLSLNEFDDLAVNDIGYATAFQKEGNEGANVAELVKRIRETGGSPEWDDISHCFAASPSNFVFYLPSMSMKESITTGVQITAEDYKSIIEVCSRFFSFIILDSPDVFYQEREGLMSFAFNISDIICFVIEPDTRSTTHLYTFLEGLKADTNRVPLDKNKCLLVVNKYASKGNPYRPYKPEKDQLNFEKIAQSTRNYFAYAVPIPLTEYRSVGNVLFGTDPAIKYAAADLADTVLRMISDNDALVEKKQRQKGHRRRR